VDYKGGGGGGGGGKDTSVFKFQRGLTYLRDEECQACEFSKERNE
jgi:hypothetical protein